MPIAPLDLPGPWTLEEAALFDDEWHRFEIVDGALLVNPPPTNFHQAVGRRIFRSLDRQAPLEWEAVLEFAFRTENGARVPDVGLIRAGLPTPRGTIGYEARDVGLIVEVVSPNTRSMDRVLKPAEYAAVGVPWYWRVETDPEVEVIASQLVGGSYIERARLVGQGTVPGPFAVMLDTRVLQGDTGEQ